MRADDQAQYFSKFGFFYADSVIQNFSSKTFVKLIVSNDETPAYSTSSNIRFV